MDSRLAKITTVSTEQPIDMATPSDGQSLNAVVTSNTVQDHYLGKRYRKYRLGPITLPYYASPSVQLTLVAFVCFLCPGMFNAVNGLGGAGQIDAKTADNANVAVYSTFAVLGFFAGSITNRLGIKTTLSIGGMGYVLYISSYLCFNHTKNEPFVVAAGAILGLCAGMLWSAQGQIMISYPREDSKGRFISWFWMIFNLGAVIGGFIPFGENFHSKHGTVTDGTYIGFIVLTFLGAVLSWCLVDAHTVVRSDGSRVILMKNPTWSTELLGLWEVLKNETWILLLFPLFWASNWFYTYQFNDINGAKFNLRTRSLNVVLSYLAQIIGSFATGYALDVKRFRRATKAKIAWVYLFVLTFSIWGGGYAYQRTYTRAQTADESYRRDDFSTDGYVGPMFLFMFYGFYDATWQTTVYWYLGALTNNGRKLAIYTGFYKGIQSAGAAVIFRIDALKAPFMNIFASSWALLASALVVAAPVIWLKIRDTVPIEEDLKFTDETYDDVKPFNEGAHRGVAMVIDNEKV